jgi:hypothetical protein
MVWKCNEVLTEHSTVDLNRRVSYTPMAFLYYSQASLGIAFSVVHVASLYMYSTHVPCGSETSNISH